MTAIALGSYLIGPESPPFIVAEMSGNHNGSLDRALQLVDAAKLAGAHAIKLQTYTADTMTLNIRDGEFLITDPDSLWFGKSLYELYQEASTPWEWHASIFQRCRERALLFFSTPFDSSAVDFLETFDAPCYKIASLEITDHPLIRKAASTGKPLILSTGGATLDEIKEAVAVARGAGCHQLILLKCTSAYPAPPESAHLKTIPNLAESFGTLVGISDHTPGIGVAIASVALGACFIEKHFTLSRSDGGVDSAFSLEPDELKALAVESERAWKALGQVRYGPTKAELGTLKFRRSLYFTQNLSAGAVITADNIRNIRPGSGLPPKEYERLIGLTVKKDVKRGEPVRWESVVSTL